MNPSLPVLSPDPERAGGISGLGTELSGIQQDNVNRAGFAWLLEQAHATASGGFARVPLRPLDAESLLSEVESLPQAGKLLPLLGRVLERASTNGEGERQVVQAINAELHQLGRLGPDSELNSTPALATLLDQLPVEKRAPNRALSDPEITTAVPRSLCK